MASCYDSKMEREARLERRRREGSWKIARSHAEAEAMDLAFWARVPAAHRLLAALELSLDLYATEDDHEAPAGLRGSPHGVRPLRS